VEVVQVVTAVATSEDVDFVLITVGRVHVARPGRLSCKLVVEPLELLQVKDVHIISCERALP